MAELEVVVFGDISGDLSDLRGELRRAKATLLYSDRVIIESVKASLLLARMGARVRHMGETLDPSVIDQDVMRRASEEFDELGLRLGMPMPPEVVARLRGMTAEELVQLPETLAEMMRARGDEYRSKSDLFSINGWVATRNYLRAHPHADESQMLRVVEELAQLGNAGAVAFDTHGAEAVSFVEKDQIDRAVRATIDSAFAAVTNAGAEQVVQPVIARSSRLDVNPEHRARTGVEFRRDRVELAVRMISSIPGFDTATPDEILDIRTKVEPHRARFRAAIVELADSLGDTSSKRDLDDAIDDSLTRTVEPALEELDQSLSDLGVGQTVARAVPSIATSTLALGAAVAVGAPDLAGVAAVTAGTATAAAKEFLERRRQENERKKNRLFLLFSAQRALDSKH